MNFKNLQKNRGMTYVELIVVLSIAGIISTISLFNYKEFQDRVDMKNLANDIALKIVEAQKNSISGKLPLTGAPSSTWKPSYGISFPDLASTGNDFFYLFTDLNQDQTIFESDIIACPSGECNQKITLNNNFYIDSITYKELVVAPDLQGRAPVLNNFFSIFPVAEAAPTLPIRGGNPNREQNILAPFHITFTRPNSGAFFKQDYGADAPLPTVEYIHIWLAKKNSSVTSHIKVYPSGRVEIN